MLMNGITSLWTQAWSSVLTDIRANEVGALFDARGHTMRLTARRSAIIVSRVRLLAAVLAVLTPLWGIVDFWTLTPDARLDFVPMRVLTSVGFAAILVMVQRVHTLRDAYRALFFLFAVPGVFFLYCNLDALHQDPASVLNGVAAGYAYLPFVMLGGLAVFPLTVVESGVLALLVLLVQAAAWLPNLPSTDWPTAIGLFWVLALIGAASMLAALSQLAFLFVMVREGLHDSFTGCYSRRAGEEVLELQFTWSSRSNSDLSVVIFAPDDLQQLNDQFGYASGDAALRSITIRLHDSMRSGDILVRWTGNEYLAVMPLSSMEQATGAVQRLVSGGLGVRPDGKPITASIGIANRTRDHAQDWWMLIDAAAARVKAARLAGGNRTVER